MSPANASMSDPTDVTQLLQDWSNGDQEALDRLLPSVYRDLQGIAHRHLVRERVDHTLNTHALVHESYINLVDGARVGWRDRGHFFAVASRAMRRILIDHARRRGAKKRGGDQVLMTLDESTVPEPEGLGRLIAIDDALTELQKHDERLARVVECRFFAGLTVGETAEALEQSPRTVERDWTRAKAYLKQALNEA